MHNHCITTGKIGANAFQIARKTRPKPSHIFSYYRLNP